MYEHLTTAELIAKAQRNRFEQALKSSGCLFSLALLIAVWVAVFRYLPVNGVARFCIALIVSPPVVHLPLVIIRFIAHFRGRVFIRELDRRCGRWSVGAYIRYFQQRIDAQTTVCLFTGTALPGGSSIGVN